MIINQGFSQQYADAMMLVAVNKITLPFYMDELKECNYALEIHADTLTNTLLEEIQKGNIDNGDLAIVKEFDKALEHKIISHNNLLEQEQLLTKIVEVSGEPNFKEVMPELITKLHVSKYFLTEMTQEYLDTLLDKLVDVMSDLTGDATVAYLEEEAYQPMFASALEFLDMLSTNFCSGRSAKQIKFLRKAFE